MSVFLFKPLLRRFRKAIGLKNLNLLMWEFDIIDLYVSSTKEVKFIQVGSNNGKTGDPIYKYIKRGGWHGILIEPVPYLFEELKSNYKDVQGLFFENNAIGLAEGESTFYRLKKNDSFDLPEWYDQLGSFN